MGERTMVEELARWQVDADSLISKIAHPTDREVMEAAKRETRACIREMQPHVDALLALVEEMPHLEDARLGFCGDRCIRCRLERIVGKVNQ